MDSEEKIMNKISITLVTVAVAASVTVCLAIQHGAGVRFREQNEAMRQRAEQLTELSAENQNLSSLILHVKNSKSLSQEQLTELLRLRSEIAQLSDNGMVEAQLERTNARLRAMEAKAQRQLAE